MGDAPLKVAITARAVAPWHGRGGLERHVNDLVRHLARLGTQVTLIVPPPHKGPAGRGPFWNDSTTQVLTVPYVTFPGAGRRGTTILDRDTAYPLFGWRAGHVAARLASRSAVDVVHGLGASVLGYALAKRRNRQLPPLVFNPQGLEEFGATDPDRAGLKVRAYWPLQRAVRLCAHAADAVIATDEALVSTVVTHLNVPAGRVQVIPNAVDVERCEALAEDEDGRRLRHAFGLDDGTFVILSVGRLEVNKGFQILAGALARLRSHSTPWRWVLVGRGPYGPALDRAVEAAGLRSRMIALDSVSDPDLHGWYRAADVFVHPTLYEGSSLVTLEAMAHGRAVVATRAGGLPDKVEPGVTGWLVPPGDGAALSAAIEEAINGRARLQAFGEAGRRLVDAKFAWPAVAARLEALYRSLIQPPVAGRSD